MTFGCVLEVVMLEGGINVTIFNHVELQFFGV